MYYRLIIIEGGVVFKSNNASPHHFGEEGKLLVGQAIGTLKIRLIDHSEYNIPSD